VEPRLGCVPLRQRRGGRQRPIPWASLSPPRPGSRKSPPGTLSPGARQVIRNGTWGQCLLKIRARAAAISDPLASPGVKAGNWNTYMVTTVPYPSQLVTLDRDITAELAKVFHALLPTRGWLTSSVLTSIGTLCEVRGAPRCYVAVSHSSALIAYLRQGGWGPSSLTPGVEERWARIKGWAHSDPPPDPRWPWAPSLARHKKAIRKLARLDGLHDDAALGSVAGALYAARCRPRQEQDHGVPPRQVQLEEVVADQRLRMGHADSQHKVQRCPSLLEVVRRRHQRHGGFSAQQSPWLGHSVLCLRRRRCPLNMVHPFA
jgi:hypothetical protein